MKRTLALLLCLSLLFSITGCKEEEKPELLFFIGITMVKPVYHLVEEFEQLHDCEIKIVQGGSQDLYDSLKQSGQGDLYMAGSYSYRKNTLSDGLLKDSVLVGYNKAALMVAEGNPKGFTGDLSQLADTENKVVICNPDSGSIGRETKKVLNEYGNYDDVFANAIFVTTDSRNITDAISNGDADICINWYATTVWDENKEDTDAIIIDEKYAKKKMLIMNLTSCSKHPELVKEFLAYASSDHGKEVFTKYGFIDDEDLAVMDGVEYE